MDQVPSLSASHGCDNVDVKQCTVCYKGLVPFGLVGGHKSPRVLSASLSDALSEKASQFFGDTSHVGVRISVGGS